MLFFAGLEGLTKTILSVLRRCGDCSEFAVKMAQGEGKEEM